MNMLDQKKQKPFMLYHETNKVLVKLSNVSNITYEDSDQHQKNFTPPSVSKYVSGKGRLYCVNMDQNRENKLSLSEKFEKVYS